MVGDGRMARAQPVDAAKGGRGLVLVLPDPSAGTTPTPGPRGVSTRSRWASNGLLQWQRRAPSKGQFSSRLSSSTSGQGARSPRERGRPCQPARVEAAAHWPDGGALDEHTAGTPHPVSDDQISLQPSSPPGPAAHRRSPCSFSSVGRERGVSDSFTVRRPARTPPPSLADPSALTHLRRRCEQETAPRAL